MTVLVDGVAVLNGNTNALFNPMIEAGFLHARCLLEFLGLKEKKGRLVAFGKRQADDVGIEDFITAEGQYLNRVSPALALATYDGTADDAERALVAMIRLANKGLAHFSSSSLSGYTDKELRIACGGIPRLIENNLYSKLGVEMPKPHQFIPSVPKAL